MNYSIQSLKYFFYRRILNKKFLSARDQIFNVNVIFEIQDAMGRRIFKRGSLDPTYAQFILSLPFTINDVMLDVGANIGWYSLVLAKNIPQSVTVYAFEPDPLNYSLLEKNIKENNLQNIKPFQIAVSNVAGTSTLYLYHPKNSGRHSLLDINSETGKSVSVETIPIDDFLTNNRIDIGSVKFVKMDIEGFEFLALKGASNLLKKLPYMFLEFSPELIRQGGGNPSEFIQWLDSFEYKYYSIDSGKPVSLKLQYLLELERTINIFLVKKNIDSFA